MHTCTDAHTPTSPQISRNQPFFSRVPKSVEAGIDLHAGNNSGYSLRVSKPLQTQDIQTEPRTSLAIFNDHIRVSHVNLVRVPAYSAGHKGRE